ncbi:MAG: hypothetical protein IPI72_11055 [Flavobacteriales bacterium]|nr:hypothetical protein [Flavobacteriales bacterium]
MGTNGRAFHFWNPPTDGDTLVVAEEGDVTIHTPAKIEALLRDRAERKNPQQGYRVQIFLGDRTTAENMTCAPDWKPNICCTN